MDSLKAWSQFLLALLLRSSFKNPFFLNLLKHASGIFGFDSSVAFPSNLLL